MSTFVIPGLNDDDKQIQVVAFGDGEKTLFTLPVLGAKGVPIGLMNAVVLLLRANEAHSERDTQYANAWAYFVDVLADNYPTAARYLASFDEAQFKHVMDHWFEQSKELGGFDPKAETSSPS